MSSYVCLSCNEPVTDLSNAISVNEFNNSGAVYLVHSWCYYCSKCLVPLSVGNAFVSNEAKLLCLNDQLCSSLPDCALCGNKCAEDLLIENGIAFHHNCRNQIMQESAPCKSPDPGSQHDEDTRLRMLSVDKVLTGVDELLTVAPSPEDGFFEMSPPSSETEILSGDEPSVGLTEEYQFVEAQNVGGEQLVEVLQQYEVVGSYEKVQDPKAVPDLKVESEPQRDRVDRILNEILTEVEAMPNQPEIQTQNINLSNEAELFSLQSAGHEQGDLYSEFQHQAQLEQYSGGAMATQGFFEGFNYAADLKPAEIRLGQNQAQTWHNNNGLARSYNPPAYSSDQICMVQSSQDHSRQVYRIVNDDQSGMLQLARVDVNNVQFSSDYHQFGQFQTFTTDQLMGPAVQDVKFAVAKKSKPTFKKEKKGVSGSVRRNRSVISHEIKAILVESFGVSPFPNSQTRIELGKLTGLDPRQVQIWFQNERRKAKLAGNFDYSLKKKRRY